MARVFQISCGQCGSPIARYQKDGPGNLRRLYLDRVIEPEALARLRHVPRKTDLSPLGCPECGQRIGMPTEHGPGNRLAWRLIPGAFRKKIEP